MKPKIIIADDSQTIQKVIKITLANENFELIECLVEDNLLDLVKESEPSLVLLDFNLSENKTGYDLSKEIHNVNQSQKSKLMMLYGTFDTVEESLFDEAGIHGHIVKPFDGRKFITMCRQLVLDSKSNDDSTMSDFTVDDNEFEDGDYEEEYSEDIESDKTREFSEDEFEDEIEEDDIQEAENIESPESESNEFKNNEASTQGVPFDESQIDEPIEEITIDEDWVVKQPEIESSDEPIQQNITAIINEENSIVSKEEMNTLEAGMQEWGIDVPGVIGQSLSSASNSSMEMPPIIETDSVDDFQVLKSEEPEEENITEKTLIMTAESMGIEPAPAEDDVFMPSKADLEYPDMGGSSKPVEIEFDTAGADRNEEIEFDSFESEEFEDSIDDSFDDGKSLTLDSTLGTNTEEEVIALEEEIADEVEDDLWEADSDKLVLSDTESTGKFVVSEILKSPVQAPVNDVTASISDEEIEARIKEKIDLRLNELMEPLIEKMVKEKIDKVIEKVSWEVIPDLAENIIKKELLKVSDEVLNNS